MSLSKCIFTPNYVKYEGVRPINIYLLRVLYFLMFVGVGLQTWGTIINHQGPWDHTKAVAYCVWAAYPTLSISGVVRARRCLMRWSLSSGRTASTLGSPAHEIAHVFIGAPFIVLTVPCVYVFNDCVLS